MERRRPASKSGGRPRKRPNVDIARTALGAVPEPRRLQSAESADRRSADDPPSSAGARELAVRVKTAAKRKPSSTKWLTRQLNDPYVARAKREGYRSRAAFKLLELDEKFGVLSKGARVVDLGCAPGGWCQVAVAKGAERVIGIDCLGMPAVPGAEILELDFLDESAPGRLKTLLGGRADVVLSDMAAPTTGHKKTDHLRIVALSEAALDFAEDVLAPGGAFICKVFQGGAENELLARLKQNFESVKHAKPKASRAESAEMYVVATGFRGPA
jgi:23S rRNA (uridine2552-2'-O)-methyltransferase